MTIRATKEENEIRNAIIKKWKEHGWDWDTNIGQATIRLLPIISAIMSDELSEFKTMVESLSDNINTTGLTSDRAKDAVLLYNALKRSGMQEDGLNYAVYAFLFGDKNSKHHPDINFDKKITRL